ncbi:MAG: multiubiquitin domain-containing protein [Bacteroidota bacterium]|nr:multiubiquitin domain-containing protein [Bacteroidota bacterium]MDP4257419.1 multiubiquitin domain-containing protein [Bacteroidota bacterium]
MHYDSEKKVLHLVINGQQHEWFHQYITGSEIRKLGGISADDEIFLKIEAPWEDELIMDATKVDLARPGLEHFFSREAPKDIKIIVNGREKRWDKHEISFKEVVELAFGKFDDRPTMVYTVAYEDGPRQNPEGSMVRGETVFVKNKMIFHATATDKS